jgi:predicted nuclease of predicted toxin-antitoxin system
VKFIVDAHLPRRLAVHLRRSGHDAVHTLDLPDKNRTTDSEINRLADIEGRVVVTKDADFVSSFVLFRRPGKLLLVSTGNMTNAELEALLSAHLRDIESAFLSYSYVELGRDSLVLHL